MSRKVSAKDAETALTAIAVVAVVPFLIVTAIHYSQLKSALLNEPGARRIIDVRRALQRLMIGASIIAGLLVAFFLVLGYASSGQGSVKSQLAPVAIVGLVFLALAVLAAGVMTGRAFAAGLIGVVVNPRRKTVSFPTDGILRSFSDTKVLASSIIPASVETISLKEIHGLTRQGGTSVLLQGEFGSRAITFSDKLRRDECLMLLSGGKRITDFELAGEGDYA